MYFSFSSASIYIYNVCYSSWIEGVQWKVMTMNQGGFQFCSSALAAATNKNMLRGGLGVRGTCLSEVQHEDNAN